jgi:hypothetical protein
MSEQKFYRTWKARIHAIPQLQQFMQDNVGASYPILVYTDDGVLVQHFYHAANQIGPDTMLIGPARVVATLACETFEVVGVNFQPFDLPLFEDVEYTLSAVERAARRPDVARLEVLYDAMLATYPEPPGSDLIAEFVTMLQRVVPPVLWPYYRALLGDLAQVGR